MRTLRRGDSGDDVRELQGALKRAGWYFYIVDGNFGFVTETAVKAFQRSSGLVVDGVAGPQTLGALGLDESVPSTPSAAEPTGNRKIISLHIGLNQVDPSQYGGWDGKLNGCENDARTMVGIAEAEGFDEIHTMFTRQATSSAVLGFIGEAAQRLKPGDLFVCTYAGHGGQLPNLNAQDDPEESGSDSTWVLWNEQLRDDLLWESWLKFAPGTNIVIISDSCHSGSVARLYLNDTSSRSYQSRASEYQKIAATTKKSFYTDLTFSRPGPASYPIELLPRPRQTSSQRDLEQVAAGAASRSSDPHSGRARTKPYTHIARAYRESTLDAATRAYEDNGTGSMDGGYATREMPWDLNEADYNARKEHYDSQERSSSSRAPLQANVLSISGCADMQLSQELNGAGVFTTTLNRVWAKNTFAGSFTGFYRDILGQMTPNQTPQKMTYGPSAAALEASTPFNR